MGKDLQTLTYKSYKDKNEVDEQEYLLTKQQTVSKIMDFEKNHRNIKKQQKVIKGKKHFFEPKIKTHSLYPVNEENLKKIQSKKKEELDNNQMINNKKIPVDEPILKHMLHL